MLPIAVFVWCFSVPTLLRGTFGDYVSVPRALGPLAYIADLASVSVTPAIEDRLPRS